MSASNVKVAAVPRRVACETSDSHQIPVDLDVLHVSRMFKKMYDDLGLEEHDEFPGVFPVKNVSTRILERVIVWCTEHKGDPEPVFERDPISQECTWFTFTEHERRFFNVPVPELLELIKAANFLDIPRLYDYACQAVAACIKGKHPAEICYVLQQDCDLDQARMTQIYEDNPWLSAAILGVRIKSPVFIPNEVLLTIFEKLPREDLERLQIVSTQFDNVIVNSVELSEQQGPLRVVTKVELGAYSYGRVSNGIDVWLRDGTVVACPDYKDLAKRLKFSLVQKMRLEAGYDGMYDADIQDLISLLPVKSAWKNATVEASFEYFSSKAVCEFAFAQLLMCKEIFLGGAAQSFSRSHRWLRLPAIAACSTLDIGGLNLYGIPAADVVEWLEHELPLAKKKWSEPRQMMVHAITIIDGMNALLTALKMAFSASTSPKPYNVRITPCLYHDDLYEVLANEKTHEVLTIRAERNKDVFVNRS